MRFLTAVLCLVFLATAPTLARADDIGDAQAFVTAMADEAVNILTTQRTRAGREAGFRKLLDERANMRRIARFTLGQFARKISKEDFEVYQGLLNDLIIKVYANRLGAYSNEKVIVGAGKNKKRNFIINSKIEFANGREPITIDWWLVKEKDDSFSLFDVRVLGVWMAQEQRDSFTSVLKNNRGDIQILLSHISKQLKTDATDSND